MQKIIKVLLVEDDRAIAGALAQALRNTHDIDIATTGQTGLYKADIGNYDIVVLDLNLPDISGKTVCQQMRERGIDTPVLVLSAESDVLAKINLLDAGANDYLTKPFSLGELKARLRVLTRNKYQPAVKPTGKLSMSGVTLDRQSHSVSRDGVAINLRRKEFALLECLMEHAGTVASRRALTRYAWQGAEDLWTNTVDVHIKCLRDKIDRPFSQPLIRTVHGLGYKIEDLPVPAEASQPELETAR